jgi:hypothetical protein
MEYDLLLFFADSLPSLIFKVPIMIQDTIMQDPTTTTQKIQVQLFQARQIKLEELHAQQAMVERMQEEVAALDAKIAYNERLSDNS